jgi:hypothetical protein
VSDGPAEMEFLFAACTYNSLNPSSSLISMPLVVTSNVVSIFTHAALLQLSAGMIRLHLVNNLYRQV